MSSGGNSTHQAAPRLFTAVLGAMIVLFVLTGFLTRSYRREKAERAERQYAAGRALAEKARFVEAIDMYTEALELSRDNLAYLQALALALLAAGRTGEAETYLQELIRSDPANGVANVSLARIKAAAGQLDQAIPYYQRAIYGRWAGNPTGNRVQTSFELIGLLERAGELTAMEAELLRLSDEAPDEPETKKRIGRLFLAARSYDNAALMFTSVASRNPRDAEAYAGIGDAEFERGNYLSARSAYRQALRYRPGDLQSRTQLDLAEQILDLNPMQRGLGSAVRYQRSVRLVARSLEASAYCLPEDLSTLPEEFRRKVEAARRAAKTRERQASWSEAVERNIALAEELENERVRSCGTPPVPDRALELVLARLAG